MTAEELCVKSIIEKHVLISVHEHLGTFSKAIMQTLAYVKEGSMATAFEGLVTPNEKLWSPILINRNTLLFF